MAYYTGTAADINALMLQVKNAAITDGWSVFVDNFSSGGMMGLSIGTVYARFQYVSSTFNDAYSISRTDGRVVMALSTSFSGTSFTSQPESNVTSTTASNVVRANDLANINMTYHIHTSGSGATFPYVHVFVETRAGHWTHFSFGLSETSSNVTAAGAGAYMFASYYVWWATSLTYSSRNDADFRGSVHRFVGDYLDQIANVCVNYKGQQAYGGGGQYATPFAFGDACQGLMDRDYIYGNLLYNRMNYWSLGMVGGIVSHTGSTAIFPILFNVKFPSLATSYWHVGSAPNIGVGNIKNQNPGDEITYGSDTYQIFPFRKKDSVIKIPSGEVSSTIRNSSQYFALLVKKVT
jgi:hypothetical protein